MIIKREQYVNRLIAAKHDNFIKIIHYHPIEA